MSKELASALHAMDADLATYAANPFAVPPVESYEERLDTDVYRDTLYGVFEHANKVLLNPREPIDLIAEPPSFMLSQKTLELAESHQAISYVACSSFDDMVCAEAELRFVHALDLAEDSSEDWAPGIVLCDSEDKPFAYLKSYGESTALAWRKATYATQKRQIQIPEGAIFEVGWSGDYADPSETNIGAGMIVAHNDVKPVVVDFKRFSTWDVPEHIRLAFCKEGARSSTNLIASIDDVMATNLAAYGVRVQNIAERAVHMHQADLPAQDRW